jgi:hypothetical protein
VCLLVLIWEREKRRRQLEGVDLVGEVVGVIASDRRSLCL